MDTVVTVVLLFGPVVVRWVWLERRVTELEDTIDRATKALAEVVGDIEEVEL